MERIMVSVFPLSGMKKQAGAHGEAVAMVGKIGARTLGKKRP